MSIAWWVINDDHTCSVGGCFFWELQLNSKAYCDYTWAWGSRSRYGYAGYADPNGSRGSGFSVNTSTGFNGDPSYNDLYAYNNGSIYEIARGIGSTFTHYVHRHFPGSCGSAWLVTG